MKTPTRRETNLSNTRASSLNSTNLDKNSLLRIKMINFLLKMKNHYMKLFRRSVRNFSQTSTLRKFQIQKWVKLTIQKSKTRLKNWSTTSNQTNWWKIRLIWKRRN